MGLKNIIVSSTSVLAMLSLSYLTRENVSADEIPESQQLKQIKQDFNSQKVVLDSTNKNIQDKKIEIKSAQDRQNQLNNQITQQQKSIKDKTDSSIEKGGYDDLEKSVIKLSKDNNDTSKKIEALKLLSGNNLSKMDQAKKDLKDLDGKLQDLQNQLNQLNNDKNNQESTLDSIQQKEDQQRKQDEQEYHKTHKTVNKQESNGAYFNPESYGMKFGSTDGWSGKWYAGTEYAGQCTEFVSSIANAIYGLSVSNADGRQMAQAYADLEGGKTSKDASIGSIVSFDSTTPAGHVAFVENVNPDGSILVAEQNTPQSGNIAGKPYTWNYRTISKDQYQSLNASFYLPQATAQQSN